MNNLNIFNNIVLEYKKEILVGGRKYGIKIRSWIRVEGFNKFF